MSAQNLHAMLTSQKLLVIGTPATALERGLLTRLRASHPDGLIEAVTTADLHGCLSAPDTAVDRLALLLNPALLDVALINELAAANCRGIVWTGAEPIPQPLLQAARPHRLRFLGSRSAGFFHAGGLNCGAFPADLGSGSLALIAQSGSIAAAAVDWAAGRSIGFSWAVTTGAECDADLADFLDLAALDPDTRAVILQIGQVRAGRKFMSAARACARLKPVVVLQSRIGDGVAPAADPVRSAAFARAGLVECETLDGLFDALSAVARIPVRRQSSVLTLGNGAGVCALGIDAVQRYGLTPGTCSDAQLSAIRELAPRTRRLNGAIDLGPVEAQALAQICKTLLSADSPDYLMLVHSPSVDTPHSEFVDALRAVDPQPRLITVWLGLNTAALARQRSNAAGLATFSTAGQAARALRFRWLHGRTRELLMLTPPVRERQARAGERCAARGIIESALQRGDGRLDGEASAAFLRAYALPAPGPALQPEALRFDLELQRHQELGMYLAITATAGPLRSPSARGFAPLDTLLAQRMIESMSLPSQPARDATLGVVLQTLSDIVLEVPAISGLRLSLGFHEGGKDAQLGDVAVELERDPPDERQRLILAPYPDALCRTLQTRNGRRYHLRPVRPEDEPALIGLLERTRPEDVRLRFFALIRHFSHEMAARLSQIDYDRELVLVAEAEDEPGHLCAVAQLVIDPYGEVGEFAILVHHLNAGAGLGHLLMNELLAYGRARGLIRIYGDVLRENRAMLALARRLGFRSRPHPDEPHCYRVEIDLPADVDAAHSLS
jgi:GNAT superfamily N-acetyltransferase/succinyl-CoA synthetase alpha subunit